MQIHCNYQLTVVWFWKAQTQLLRFTQNKVILFVAFCYLTAISGSVLNVREGLTTIEAMPTTYGTITVNSTGNLHLGASIAIQLQNTTQRNQLALPNVRETTWTILSSFFFTDIFSQLGNKIPIIFSGALNLFSDHGNGDTIISMVTFVNGSTIVTDGNLLDHFCFLFFELS